MRDVILDGPSTTIRNLGHLSTERRPRYELSAVQLVLISDSSSDLVIIVRGPTFTLDGKGIVERLLRSAALPSKASIAWND